MAARVRYSRCLYDAKKYRKLTELAKKYPSVQGSSYLLLRKAETVNEPDSSTVQLKKSSWRRKHCSSIWNAGDWTHREKDDFPSLFFPSILCSYAVQIQILALAAHIPAENQIKGAANRYSVSMDLKYGQRVCDFRSFFFALEEKLGLKEAQGLPFLQDERVDIPIETIITDWSELDEGG
ncbi:hypothetical protein MBR_04861, partial [Metarhizium brunneum ARSEF 3297]